MNHRFDSSLWARAGIPFDYDEPSRPYAEEANRLQYHSWEPRRSWLQRMFQAPILLPADRRLRS